MNTQKTANLLKAVANADRIKILASLRMHREGASVGQIAEDTGVAFKSVSKHLGILYGEGIVEQHVDGQFRVYTLENRQHRAVKALIETL